MRCYPEAARVRASSGASSTRGSYPVAMAASGPASRDPQTTERADDASTDFLDHGGDVRVGRWLPFHKTWLAVLATAIAIHPLKKNAMRGAERCAASAVAFCSRHGQSARWMRAARFGVSLRANRSCRLTPPTSATTTSPIWMPSRMANRTPVLGSSRTWTVCEHGHPRP